MIHTDCHTLLSKPETLLQHLIAKCHPGRCAAVDWEEWSDAERRAALSSVLMPRGRSDLLNAADFEDAGPNKPAEFRPGGGAAARSAFPRRTDSLERRLEGSESFGARARGAARARTAKSSRRLIRASLHPRPVRAHGCLAASVHC